MPLKHSTRPDFFHDIPWLHVPAERLGNLVANPHIPHGRLLGGSSKPSKLAALAASRRKNEENLKPSSPLNENVKPDRAISLLDQLGKKDTGDSSPVRVGPKGLVPQEPRKITLRPKLAPVEPQKPILSEQEQDEVTSPADAYPVADMRAEPSMFAATMLGAASGQKSRGVSAKASILVHHYPVSKAFSGPSPDDIVLKAQAKASARG